MAERPIFARLGVKDAQRAGDDLRRFGETGDKSIGRIAASAKLASAAFVAMTAAAAGAGEVLRRTTLAGAEYERFLLRTQAQLGATSFASGQTARSLDQLTFSLAKQTLTSTRGAREAAASLLTFRSIAGETFKETLVLAQDLASAGFGNLQSNAVQLAKALEDPATGLTMLRRVGVSFTQQQRDMIKAMTAAGDAAGAQRVILDALQAQVGGAGVGEAGGLSGAWDTLTETVDRWFELLAERRGVMEDMTSLVEGLRGAFEGLTEVLGVGAEDLDLFDAASLERSRQRQLTLERQFEEIRDERPELPANVRSDALLRLNRMITEEQRKQQAIGLRFAELRREEEQALKAADLEARRRTADQQEALRLEEERTAAKKAQAAFDQERKRALADIERLEKAASLAGLEGLELLEAKRRQAEAEQQERRAAGVIKEQEHSRALLAIEAQFQADKTDLEEKAQAERDRDQARLAKAQERELQRQAEAQARLQIEPFLQAANEIQAGFSDAFFEIFRHGKLEAESFTDAFKDIFARMLAELATLAIARPIIVPVVQALGAAVGLGAGATSALGSALGGGPLGAGGNLFGASGFIPALNEFGAGLGFAPTGGGVVGPLGPQLPGGFFGSGATLAGTLGAAGLGFGGGTLLASLTNGSELGGGLGGAAGAGLGFAVGGPIGGIIGGLAGGFGGSLFGGGSQDSEGHRNIEVARGRFVRGGGRGSGSGNDELRAQADQVADQAIAILNAMLDNFQHLGLQAVRGRGEAARSRFSSAGRFDTPEELIAQALRRGALGSSDPRIGLLLRRTPADQLQNTLSRAQGILQLGEAVEPSTLAGAFRVLKRQFRSLRNEAIELGLGTTEVRKGFERAKAALEESILGGVRAFAEELQISSVAPISPLERFGRSEARFGEISAQALRGDLEAIGDLPGVAGQFIDVARETFASGPGFAEVFERVTGVLERVGGQDPGRAGELQVLAIEQSSEAASRNAARQLDKLSQLSKNQTKTNDELKRMRKILGIIGRNTANTVARIGAR